MEITEYVVQATLESVCSQVWRLQSATAVLSLTMYKSEELLALKMFVLVFEK